MVTGLTELGFEQVRIVEYFDPFRATSKEKTARKFGVHSVNLYARKPEPR